MRTGGAAGGFRPAEQKQPAVGEVKVWLTSLGLAAGLVLITGLLALIVIRGLEVFWPKRIVEIQLREGSGLELAGQRVLVGSIVERRVRTVHASGGEDGVVAPDAVEEEWQVFVGNRDVFGLAFHFVSAAQVERVREVPGVMVLERYSQGPAIGWPVAIEAAGGERRAEAGDAGFEEAFAREMREASDRRTRIGVIERGVIGAINRDIERLRLEERRLTGAGGGSGGPDREERLAAVAVERARLQQEFEREAAEAGRLRQEQERTVLRYRLAGGAERTVPFGELVGAWAPNEMSLAGRCGHFVRRFAGFILDNPRASNTEGGIFPALFGTFVMTLFMSVAVTPFGVLAAIYLREYARQGMFVRSVRISVNNLAGVPSIVFGVFGLGFFVYFVGGTIDSLFYADRLPSPTFGTGGIMWASLTLALLTLPVVIVATEEALAAVPRSMREASLACGASKWQTIQGVVLPAAAPGILTGFILAMARGAGEVAPLMLVGVVKLQEELPLDATVPFIHPERKFMHLGFHVFDLGFQSPDSEAARPMVFASAFVLILLVLILNLGAILIRNRLRRRYIGGGI